MLSKISMVTTKIIAREYTQKEMKWKFKSAKHKEGSNVNMRDKKAIGHIKHKYRNDGSKYLLISNYFNYK